MFLETSCNLLNNQYESRIEAKRRPKTAPGAARDPECYEDFELSRVRAGFQDARAPAQAVSRSPCPPGLPSSSSPGSREIPQTTRLSLKVDLDLRGYLEDQGVILVILANMVNSILPQSKAKKAGKNKKMPKSPFPKFPIFPIRFPGEPRPNTARDLCGSK